MKPTRTKTTAPKLPFEVPPQVQHAIATAGVELEKIGAKAKTAAVNAEKKVRVAARDLAKTGESFRKDPRAFVEDVVESGKGLGLKLRKDVQTRVRKASTEAARRAEGAAKKVGDTVGSAVETGLHRLNVPTRHELKTLAAKVDTLGKKIDGLKSRKPARTRRTR